MKIKIDVALRNGRQARMPTRDGVQEICAKISPRGLACAKILLILVFPPSGTMATTLKRKTSASEGDPGQKKKKPRRSETPLTVADLAPPSSKSTDQRDMHSRARSSVLEEASEEQGVDYTHRASLGNNFIYTKYSYPRGRRETLPVPDPLNNPFVNPRAPESLSESEEENPQPELISEVGSPLPIPFGHPRVEEADSIEHDEDDGLFQNGGDDPVDTNLNTSDFPDDPVPAVEQFLNPVVEDRTPMELATLIVQIRLKALDMKKEQTPSKFPKHDSLPKIEEIWSKLGDIAQVFEMLKTVQRQHGTIVAVVTSNLAGIAKSQAALATANTLRALKPPENFDRLLEWTEELASALREWKGAPQQFALVCRDMLYRMAIETILKELQALVRTLEYAKAIGDDTFVGSVVYPWFACLGNEADLQNLARTKPGRPLCSVCGTSPLERKGRLVERDFGTLVCLACKLREVEQIGDWATLLGITQGEMAEMFNKAHSIGGKEFYKNNDLRALFAAASHKFLGL